MNYNYEKQHRNNKLHAIERMNKILDRGSFQEIGSLVHHSSVMFGMDKRELLMMG